MSKSVLVTGAASGIGRATVERLAGSGWRVLAVDRDVDKLAWAEGRADIAALAADVSSEADNARMVSEAERLSELEMLANYVYARTVKGVAVDCDVIVMGDFNIPDLNSPLYKAVTSKGLMMPEALAGITGSNLARNKRYDQILHNPVFSKSFTGQGGVLDFIGDGWSDLYPMAKSPFDQDYTYQMSDHLPLWVMINTDIDGELLDQILAPQRANSDRHDRDGG